MVTIRGRSVTDTPTLGLATTQTANWFLLLLLGILAAGLVQFYVTGRRNSRAGSERLTGRVLEPQRVVLPESGDAPYLWRAEGRGWIVGQRGSARSVLEVRQGAITLWLRPWILQSVLGGHLHAEAGDDFVAFPVRWLGHACVGLRRPDQSAYFETTEPETVLGVLAAAGFQVSWAEEQARRI